MGEVIRDDRALCLKCRRGDEQVGIRQQRFAPIELRIQGGRPFDDTIRQGEDETDLTQSFKGDLLRLGLLGLEPGQDFISRDDGEGESRLCSAK
jgi:hypothetical protein